MAGFFEAASHFDTGEGGTGPDPLRKLIVVIEDGADIDGADRDGMTLLHHHLHTIIPPPPPPHHHRRARCKASLTERGGNMASADLRISGFQV